MVAGARPPSRLGDRSAIRYSGLEARNDEPAVSPPAVQHPDRPGHPGAPKRLGPGSPRELEELPISLASVARAPGPSGPPVKRSSDAANLGGHPVLFPDDAVRWTGQLTLAAHVLPECIGARPGNGCTKRHAPKVGRDERRGNPARVPFPTSSPSVILTRTDFDGDLGCPGFRRVGILDIRPLSLPDAESRTRLG